MFVAIDKSTQSYMALYDTVDDHILEWADQNGVVFAQVGDDFALYEKALNDEDNDVVIVPKKADDSLYIDALRTYQKRRITESKRRARQRGVKVGDYTYFAEPEDVMKYKHAMELGLRMARKAGVDWKTFKGEIKVKEGIVTVDGATFDAALEALDLFLYETWKKEQALHLSIDQATSKEAIESIVWEESDA